MAWQYSDYESQSDDSLRLQRLNLFIGEITASIHADYSINGRSVNTAHLESLLSTVLYPRRAELERVAGVVTEANRASFVRIRPL